MKNLVKVKYDDKTKDYFLDIKDLLVDSKIKIKSVKFYTLEESNESLILKLYDKNKKIIRLV